MPKTTTAPAVFANQAEYIAIPLTAVNSSQIKEVGHDPATNTLAIAFAHTPGVVYQYPDCDADLHAAFVSAESIGKFFGAHIKPLAFKKFKAPEVAA